MKRIVIILTLCAVSAGIWGIVPPRNPADTIAYHQRVRAMRTSDRKTPAREEAVGTVRVFPRVPVILVSYPDMPYRLNRADIDSMFNAQHFDLDGATGSVRQYFYDQSSGAYNPQFDIYGPVTVGNNYAHYANRASKLVLEACALMDDSLDFSLYDTDGDGTVDLTYCLYAGPPASDGNYIDKTWISNSSNLVWPHYHTISAAGTYGLTSTFDGKKIDEYEVSSELDGCFSSATKAVMAGVGLACHEFGHGLGLPDIYSTTDQTTHKTCGQWDVMDYGCYNNNVHTPPCYSAYERWFMGWLTPQLINKAANVTLQALSSSNTAAYITTSGEAISTVTRPNPNLFYMLENRQPTGWDAYLPGHGLIITRINYRSTWWTGNTVNVTAGNLGIDLIEADGDAPTYQAGVKNGFYGKLTDAFPFGASSYYGITNFSITDIEETEGLNEGLIRFKVNGGDPTGVERQESSVKSREKILRDGQMVIVRDGKEYDVLGRLL
ncbi:MAG: M6 family metalloprotease domain-containing protein [Paludibacteraceae bacterium]|nr:M6 family metalloprotease domain-containing protein [Paludibacteraceae bacterium]